MMINNLMQYNTPQLKLPVGSDDFSKLALSDLFVDKSLFIKEVLSASDEAILITRPRRWGKTSNLQMLKYFLSVDVDENGNIKKENSSRILFVGGKLTQDDSELTEFKRLKIVEVNDGYYMRYQGQYPVIFISFRDVKQKSQAEIEEKLKEVISNVYRQHEYLSKVLGKGAGEVDKANLIKFNRILNQDFSKSELESSLKFLSLLLYKHFNKRVYILVDEYDAAFNFLLEESLDNEEQHKLRKEIALLMTSILSACGKGNDALEKIILTGIFDTLKKEGNSGFNNIRVYGVLDPDYSSCFGFSLTEINEQLLRKFDLKNDLINEISINIKNWYNGYNIPVYNKQTYKNDRIYIYTPWAVINYLYDFSKGKIEPESYWSKSGASAILSNLLQVGVDETLRDKFTVLAQGEKQQLDFKKGISLIKYEADAYKNDERLFAYLLINSGYLTAEEVDNKYIFYVPNFEVKEEFIDCIYEELKSWKKFIVSDPFVEALIKVNPTMLQGILTQYIRETFSNLDMPKHDKVFTAEKVYHAFVLGLLQRMLKTHIVKSEADSGFGRADVVVLPRAIDSSINKNAEGTGFVIELKRMASEDRKNKISLETLAQKGLQQIKGKEYRTILEQHEVRNKVFISIAFYGKDVSILIETELTETFNSDVEWNYAQGKMSRVLW